MGGSTEVPESSSLGVASTSMGRPTFPRQRSRGQLARRNSITRGSDKVQDKLHKRHSHGSTGARLPRTSPSTGRASREERPWLGGLYFTDLVFIAFTYSVNLLRTCGLAELADIAFKGLVYVFTLLPYDLYCRWSLSKPPASTQAKQRGRRRPHVPRSRKSMLLKQQGSSSESETTDGFQPQVFTSSSEPEPGFPFAHSPDQLSPFHHIVLLLIRFVTANFPHLVPRILFAEETIGPFVYWRTGGGSNAMVQEFTDLQRTPVPAIQDVQQGRQVPRPQEPKFRAYLLSKDARLPMEVQRTNMASRSATTLLYLHGGGFSLGSVAFYAEALLRLRAKVSALEGQSDGKDTVAEARCVAVEYDLSPAARFPTPLLQCLRCYAHLIEVDRVEPSSICVAGDSAGGNLAMGLLLCLDGQMKGEEMLAERDWSQLPMPGKALLISPWVDLRPSHSRAFSDLRNIDDADKKKGAFSREKQAQTHEASRSAPTKGAKEWTEVVAEYEWDYVASEALLHFAQVYTGILPSPRRVRGPLGWIAHLCGAIAQEIGEESKTSPAKGGYIDPMGALSALVRPSKRLAQATHDMLSDPFISKILGLHDANVSLDQDLSQTVATPLASNSSFEPLFSASDRKTEVVRSKEDLYLPIGQLGQTRSTTDKIGMNRPKEDEARWKAERLLDSHPLLSPAIGDWSRIKLKHGCLVTWGERERMAEDIEAWVDSVYDDADSRQDVPPAQDGESQPKMKRKSGDGDIGDDAGWLETAVERGPGGVHAWPFVSMYLAGTESERERGLDLLADFVARSEPEAGPAAALHTSMTGEEALLDLPHAAPDSPVSEPDSVGSMPSDVDLHGLVGEDDEDDGGEGEDTERFDGPAPVIDIVEAVRKARERGASDASQDSTHGLGLSNDLTSQGGPDEEDLDLTPSRAIAPVRFVGSQMQPSPTRPAAVQRERGRSRSPRQTMGLNTQWSAPPDAPLFVSSVRLHRPDMAHANKSYEDVGRQEEQPQSAPPLWWIAAASGDSDDAQERQEEVVDTAMADKDDNTGQASRVLEDLLEVSSDEAFSLTRSLSPPAQNEEAAVSALAAAPLDVSHYGLSHYAVYRPEPEGLSDIAEEGSVLSASYTSGDIASRSRSPADGNIRNFSPPPSLAAASMMMRDEEESSQWRRSRWAVEEDDGGSEEGEQDEGQGDEYGSGGGSRGDEVEMAFSPPAQPQPGPSIPVTAARTAAWKSTDDLSSAMGESSSSSSPSAQSPAIGIVRKKPKGDVWW